MLEVVTAALALANWAESESGGGCCVVAQPADSKARKRMEGRNVMDRNSEYAGCAVY
jgi:hypothetical protein